jgi:hypothetical protein
MANSDQVGIGDGLYDSIFLQDIVVHGSALTASLVVYCQRNLS